MIKLVWTQTWWGGWLIAWVDLIGALLELLSFSLLRSLRFRLTLWTFELGFDAASRNSPTSSSAPPRQEEEKRCQLGWNMRLVSLCDLCGHSLPDHAEGCFMDDKTFLEILKKTHPRLFSLRKEK